MNDFSTLLGPGYMNLLVRRLGQRLATSADTYFERSGVKVSARSTSVLAYLAQRDGASIAEISGVLGLSHQAIAKAIEHLEARRLVRSVPHPGDGRALSISLTPQGRDEYKAVQKAAEVAAAVFADIFDEIGVDVFEALQRMEASIERRPLEGRLMERSQSLTASVKRKRRR